MGLSTGGLLLKTSFIVRCRELFDDLMIRIGTKKEMTWPTGQPIYILIPPFSCIDRPTRAGDPPICSLA
jgi:hypothetical protein